MSDPRDNNPNIVEDGKNTRFGAPGGPDPRAAAMSDKKDRSHEWAVRKAVKKLMRAEFDITEPVTPQTLSRAFQNRKDTIMTIAQMVAVKKVTKALKGDGDTKMLAQITDDADGKQTQTIVEAKASLADILAASYDDGDMARLGHSDGTPTDQ